MKNIYLAIIVLLLSAPVIGQNVNNNTKLAENKSLSASEKKAIAIEYAKANNLPIRVDNNGVLMEIMFIDERGNPQYYITHNEDAAESISTDALYSGGALGLSLDGTGITVYEWDGGTVLHTHDEFDTRVTNMDPEGTHYHATHVAGTIMASGVESGVQGMAFNANLKAYHWDDDNEEMIEAAANGALISNHSYGFVRGWYYDGGWLWNGDAGVSTAEDYLFGFYDSEAAGWDNIAYNAPNYLIVKSAGNDRGDGPIGGAYPQDGQYDCIGTKGIAKNILTVGAVNDIVGGYSIPADVVATSFTSWGPADDGRIKPDIVANGLTLKSSTDTGDSDYITISGTSMSSPSVTGSAALLIEHYEDENGAGSVMKAATLKGLIIHTADEAGTNDGPDYMFGWGLMNTKSAAEKITEDQTTDVIQELELLDGESYTRNITTNGTSPITVTVVWNDPAGTPPATASLDPTDVMLVNDLDVKITQGANTYYPWKLDGANPANAATKLTENNVDNVENIYIASPSDATTYTITVDHDGSLSNGRQAFSMIISGDIINNVAPSAEFTVDKISPTNNVPVQFSDASSNIPTSWSWSISPSTVNYVNSTSSSSQNPEVEFTAIGTYQVSLTATNAHGSDTKTKVGYIVVGDAPSGYCEAYSANAYGYISKIQAESIDNSSSATNVGDPDPNEKYYEDWTAVSTDVFLNTSYNITVTSPSNDANLDLGIWCDWNRDGDFHDTDEEILCGIDNGGEGTFSLNVPSHASTGKTRMRVRTKYYGSECSSCGSTGNGEVEDYTLNVLGSWTGTTNTDWATTTNWIQESVPTAADHVIIPTAPSGGNFPLIGSGTAATSNNLEIEAGASLSIRGSLTVSGTLTNTPGASGIVIKSDASGSGSLIQSTSSISATVERYIAKWTGDSDGWHFLSSPVATFNINGSEFEPGATDDLFSWDEFTGFWENYKDPAGPTQIIMGQGYLISRAATDTKEFSGVLNNANKTWSNLSNTPANSTAGWHLLGNPFASALLWDNGSWAMSAAVSGTAKIFKESTASYIDISSGGVIPATQGFLVYVSSGTNSITIPLADRSHETQNWYKEEEVNKIKLTVFDTQENTAQESVVKINENATEEYDNEYDSYFFRGFAPAFYSVIPEGNLSTNSIPEVNWRTNIPFAFIKNNSTNYYIEAEGINSLEPQESVFLTDLKLNHSQNLNTNPVYSFTAADGDLEERFLLHFSATNIDDVENLEQITVYASKGRIELVNSQAIDSEVFIYNTAGQLLAQQKLNKQSAASINMADFKGAALVTIVSNNSVITKKVMVF